MPGFAKKYLKYWFLAVLGGTVFLVWYAVDAESQNGLLVAFLNVGQGDALLINSPTGQQILIDGGPDKQVLSEISKIMPFYDRSIDVVIATHPDADHIGGLPDVLRRYNVDLVIEPGAESDSAVFKEFEKLVEDKKLKKVLARRGMKLILGDDAYLLILFPDRDVSGLDSNDASIVIKLVYKDTSFLFTGDSPKKMEEYLVFLDKESLNADVLKVGHHGSETSSSENFLEVVSPVYTVVSVGENNRYGHPCQEVLDKLAEFGTVILRTDEFGLIKIKSDGKEIWSTQEKKKL